MKEEELAKILIAAELEANKKGPVETVVDTTVEIIEAPFKIAGRLFDDLFGF